MQKELTNLESLQNVSRETLWNDSKKLRKYLELLDKWNKTINLVSPSTMAEAWERHFIDSAQLYTLLPNPTESILLDMGSGAGFPGMVLAILGVHEVHLIESDARKCAFLAEVARQTETKVKIHNERIEKVNLKVDIITARALAPLPRLMEYAKNFMHERTQCFFLKGQEYAAELEALRTTMEINVTETPSMTSKTGMILAIKGR